MVTVTGEPTMASCRRSFIVSLSLLNWGIYVFAAGGGLGCGATLKSSRLQLAGGRLFRG
jgi:hypothetical protein